LVSIVLLGRRFCDFRVLFALTLLDFPLLQLRSMTRLTKKLVYLIVQRSWFICFSFSFSQGLQKELALATFLYQQVFVCCPGL
jgi:hypothetical protein